MPPNGATRKNRTPSRCVQGSYAPERWWPGDQPWDRTTFSRASAERYDHTSSLVVGWSRRQESNPRLRLTRAPCFRQHFVDLVQARGFEPRFSGNRPDVLPVGRSLGWSRRLESNQHGSAQKAVGCRAGIRTQIFPRNRRTCYRCHHPTNETRKEKRDWLPDVDSNHDPRRQRPLSCRWTIWQWSGREDSNLHEPAPEAGGLPITLRPEEVRLG